MALSAQIGAAQVGDAQVGSTGSSGAPSFSFNVSTTHTLGAQTLTATFANVDAPLSNPFSELVSFASLASYTVLSQFVATIELTVTSLDGAIAISDTTTSTARTVTAAAAAPDAPTVSAANTNKGTIAVTITPGAANGAAIDGYTASRSGWTDLNAGETTLTHILSGGTLYASGTVDVTAHNSAGTSSAGTSGAVTATKRGRWYLPDPIDHTKFPASGLTSFPVPITIQNDLLKLTAYGGRVTSAYGYDIGTFTSAAGTTPLPWEIESYNGVTGTVTLWPAVTTDSAVDVPCYLFYGNSFITTAQNTPTAAWDANHKGVYHLSAASSAITLTKNATPILPHGGVGAWNEVLTAQLFCLVDRRDTSKILAFYMGIAGDHSSCGIGRATANASSDLSLAASWTVDAGNPLIVPSGLVNAVEWESDVSDTLYFYVSNLVSREIDLYKSVDYGTTITLDTAGILTPTGQTRDDGTSVEDFAVTTVGGVSYGYYAYRTAITTLPGIRYATCSASNRRTWVKQGSGDIVSKGTLGTCDSSYLEFHDIPRLYGSTYIMLCETFNGTLYEVSAYYSSSLAGPFLKSGANPVMQRSGVSLQFDKDHATGPTLFTNTNGSGESYMFFAGGIGTNYADDATRWSIGAAKFTGSPLTLIQKGIADSTSAANDLTLQSGVASTGEISGAYAFAGLPSHAGSATAATTAIDNVTLSCWAKVTTRPQNGIIVCNGAEDNATGGKAYGFGVNDGAGASGSKLALFCNTGWMATDYTFTDDDWHYIVMKRTSGTWTALVDNVAVTVSNNTTTPTAPDTNFHIGSFTGVNFFLGEVDEVRVSNVARSANWETSNYNVGVDPTDNATLGSETDTGIPLMVATAVIITGDSSGVGGTPVTLTISADGAITGTLSGSIAWAGGTLSSSSYSLTSGSPTQEVIATPTVLGTNNVTTSGQNQALTEASFAYTATAETISLGGASSANRAVASAAITVSLNAAAHADTIVTLATAGTGSFNPATLTVLAGATSATGTATYTGTVSGATTLSTTNNKSMTNASGYAFTVVAVPAASLSGTATLGLLEAAIIAGGKTIIITLIDDTWVAAGATFNAQRQAIINGIDSNLAGVTGWDATVKATQDVAGVVRTSPLIVTITLDAQATYDINGAERITVTVPAAALTANGALAAGSFNAGNSGAYSLMRRRRR